ncbi:MAG TPA: hypothetical protein VHI99_10030 [Vicinamibacterales bacterium]|nr:hypothetical protein [Vicinamibacterales bacterium]
MFPDNHEHILDDLFGIGRARYDPSHDRRNTPSVPPHQLSKGFLLSCSNGRKERLVGFGGA